LLSVYNLGFTSQQSAISFDLLTTGLTVGLWDEIDEGIALISSEISAKLTTDVSKGLTHIPASLKYARSPK